MGTTMPRARGLFLGAALSLVVVACGSSSATPTPTAVPVAQSPLESALASVIANAATPTPTEAAPTATPTATPTTTTAASATPAPTATPAATPTPAPSTQTASNGCAGTSVNRKWFSDTAPSLPWKTYCAVLPSDWWLLGASVEHIDGTELGAEYTNGRHFILELLEGNICEGSCTLDDPFKTSSKIWLSDMGAYLYWLPMISVPFPTGKLTQDSMGVFMAIAPTNNPNVAYALIGAGMSYGTFSKLAKAVIRVPTA